LDHGASRDGSGAVSTSSLAILANTSRPERHDAPTPAEPGDLPWGLAACPSLRLQRVIIERGIPVAAGRQVRHHDRMGSGSNPSIKPELFPAQQPPDASSPAANEPKLLLGRKDKPAAVSPSYALPTNLPNALRHLDNAQLDRLFAAVLAEQQARGGKKLPLLDEPSRKRPIKEVAPPLAQGKLNAVRAAFKAGVTPSRIARQFGISQSDVRKALASDETKR
jgi:hypothetical protein